MKPTVSNGYSEQKERLQKILASCGVASRRKSEEYILSGRVSVNGHVVKILGTKVNSERDQICVDGKIIRPEERAIFILNKPPGYICTNIETHGRKKAVDLIKNHLKLFTVGRLDMESEGLILVTNDGDFAQRVAHPSYDMEKEYRVFIEPVLKSQDADRIIQGISLPDGMFNPIAVKVEKGGREIVLVIHEGRNRILRRVFKALGYRVTRLIRTRIGSLELGPLKSGMFLELNKEDIRRYFAI